MAENYETINTSEGKVIKAWTRGVPFDENARRQVEHMANLSIVFRWVAVMPDVHLGKGATVGSVIPTLNAIIPAAVGVDIGCGMIAQKTTLKAKNLPDNLRELRRAIERAVPVGRTGHGHRDQGAWGNPPEDVLKEWKKLSPEFKAIIEKHPTVARGNTVVHLGTLGTGNHFIEVSLDEDQNVWIMLHSGSRGVGNLIGRYFIDLAKKDMQTHLKDLPDKDLAYLSEGTKHFADYVEAVLWAQTFARVNRDLMMRHIVETLRRDGTLPPFEVTEQAVNCHHNYVQKEFHFHRDVWVTRKGAVSAKFGELGIIPGSMGAKSYIVRGLGNPESFASCAHGAGRTMSRGEAKRSISLEEHEQDTVGVECRKDKGVIDESPRAYKNIDAVMTAQSDLVEIVHTLKQIICVKG
ncbi:MAG: RtcB family protein [Deltaproteobacteria bacterium]|nr:RtcB family protein [Deltaproteobacteria bacterium]